MKVYTRWLLALVLPLAMSGAALAADITEGKQFVRLANPQPTNSGDKIEVVELFWYGCPHCYRLEPDVGKWLENKPDDVEFVRMPAIVGPPWELLAKAYYTSEFLGVTDKTHDALFEAIHKDKKRIVTDAAVKAVFMEQGVSEDDFDNTFNSFAVSVKVNNAKQMTRRYDINGVPTLIVNGKYSTSGSQAGSNAKIIETVDYLIVQEREQPAATASQ